MINELYKLTVALDQADITTERTHPKYKLIPKVTKKAPCIHIIFDNGQLYKVESVEMEQAAEIRKYGSNQGTFPALNLTPLYRLTDEIEKRTISDLIEGKTTDFNIEDIHQICRENNWGKKFSNKYRISMQDVPREMTELFQKTGTVFLPLQQLTGETDAFAEAEHLHRELEHAAFAMLEQKRGIALALQILFYPGKPGKNVEEDYGTLSVVMDCRELIRAGLSVTTAAFTSLLNQKLIEADAAARTGAVEKEADAFGHVFAPLEEPMPTVKLAAGFEVSLRTMFRGQPCQSRYGRIENATYPISKEMRFKLQSALAWISAAEHKGITWISTDKDEALFAYPETLRKNMYSMVGFCRRWSTEEDRAESETRDKIRKKAEFESAAKVFISELQKTKQADTDPMSERIQYFVLRKLDKARTKVVYTYNTIPAEIEHSSERWSLGCQNLPAFLFGQPATLFPLEVSDILNLIWRQDGKSSADKFKPVPRYYGMQLLFGVELPEVRRNLYVLMNNVINLAPYLGKAGFARNGYDDSQVILLRQTQNTLALTGLLLYQLEVRKEKYMQEFPYLFGQLLKVSDALHEIYCKIERDNNVPNVLAGSGLYVSGAEQPYKTLAVLGQRMNPYIAWAKRYRAKNIQKKGEESWRAGRYLSLYERIATQLYAAWGDQNRFNEEEKAQYFIGYLADFPAKEETEGQKSSEQTCVVENEISYGSQK
ncbi:hypothetical protein ADH76_17040 [Enterocloster clostridioformis]|uniref:hypothetical protein n=2 Tax=Enterocloster clostridioformis TaxID=1531 RepID=UPI00080C8471|nr:hypothetical protein [Enterocloster clostridioformis]ANU45811.1 hypothetical protein A4V08_08320 [Lachnoclostridium sp. YL32]NDO30333.1 hypothetical protein [Enterocloster clostridioformis]OXE67686.1 hypothetical protein ADH76_17040 [Enterocloster clostridioformis]QQQ99441.1 hypothetical protein I5Q83_26320 [Enterocloster clostridioformis]